MLRLRRILEEHSPNIKYIIGEKKILSDKLSILPLNGNKETTQKSTSKQEILSEINNIKEISEIPPLLIKLIKKINGRNLA